MKPKNFPERKRQRRIRALERLRKRFRNTPPKYVDDYAVHDMHVLEQRIGTGSARGQQSKKQHVCRSS